MISHPGLAREQAYDLGAIMAKVNRPPELTGGPTSVDSYQRGKTEKINVGFNYLLSPTLVEEPMETSIANTEVIGKQDLF